MVAHVGRIESEIQWGTNPVLSQDEQLAQETIEQIRGGDKRGTQTKILITLPQKQHKGRILNDVVQNVLSSVYVFPRDIDFGFIVNDLNQDITIWNPLATQVTIINIQKINEAGGVQLANDLLPDIINAECDIKQTVTAFKEGPPVQNTTYIYTIGSEAYTVTVIGKRIVAFVWEPEWKNPIKFRYRFQTVLNKTERFTEQRRPMTTDPIRMESADFFFQEIEQETFIQDVKQLTSKVLAIPIWQEPINPTQDLQGLVTFSVEENLDNYFNLKNYTTFLLFLKISDVQQSEIHEISVLGTNTITIQTPIVADYKVGDSVVYPIFIGIIDKKNFTVLTQEDILASIEFQEVLL